MRIGTRRSALALAQAEAVARMLGGAELVPIVTSGDRGGDGAGRGAGGGHGAGRGAGGEDKSRWVRELESALAGGEIDLAVHSAKDVPAELAPGLELIGTPARGPAEDVICGVRGLAELAHGARVGTSSVRRAAQLRAARADLEVVALRGNVDTRLRKLAEGEQALAAIVLALAGLERLGRGTEAGGVLDSERHTPAPGQGVIVLQGRGADGRAREAALEITDARTFACLAAERALASALDASCHTPLGAHAITAAPGLLHLSAWVGLPDGSAWLCDELDGPQSEPASLGRALAARMSAAGAGEILAGASRMAQVSGG
jgi:hydroxymethylbilane synthase